MRYVSWRWRKFRHTRVLNLIALIGLSLIVQGCHLSLLASPTRGAGDAAPGSIEGALLVSGAASTTAGDCMPLTVSVVDENQAPKAVTANLVVSMVTSGGPGLFYRDAGCATGAVNTIKIPSGDSSVSVYFKGTLAGDLDVNPVNVALKADPIPLQVSIIPGAPDHLAKVSGDAASATVGTALSSDPIVQVLDAYGNAVPGVGLAYTVMSGGGNVGSATATSSQSGLASTAFTLGTTSGANTFQVAGSTALPGTPATVTFTATGMADVAVAANSTIVTSPNSGAQADGTTSSTVTVTLRDQYQNPVSGTLVQFSSTGTGNTLTQPGSTTNASGQATGTIKTTVAEAKTVAISTPAGFGAITDNVTFIPGAVSVANSTITGTGPVTADGAATSTVTITLKDANNNVVANVTPTFSATDTGAKNAYGACSATDASGVSTCTLASTHAETKTLSIATPVTKAGGNVVFQADVPSAVTSTIVTTLVGGVNPIADNVSRGHVTITLLDSHSNPIAGVTPTFSATDTGSTNGYLACSASGSNGVSTCSFTSTKAETKTVSIATPVVVVGNTITFDPGAAAVANSSIVGTGPVNADGAATSTVTITIGDAFQNPISGVTPTFSATDTGTTNSYGACSSSNASGQSTCTLASSYAETKTLSLVTPVSKGGGTVTFGASKLAFSTQPQATPDYGVALSPQPVVEARDASNHVDGAFGNNIDLALYTDATCQTVATGSSISGSPVLASSGVSTFTAFTISTAGPFYVQASSAGLTSACSSLVTVTQSFVTPSFVQSVSGHHSGSSTFTVTLPAPTTAGNFIIVGVNDDGNNRHVTSISDNAPGGSSTYVTAGVKSTGISSWVGHNTEIWYAAAPNAGATDFTVNLNGNGQVQVFVAEFWGIKKSSPIDVVATAQADSSPGDTPGAAITTTKTNDIVFSSGVVSGTVSGVSSGNPFTGIGVQNGNPAAYLVAATPGTYQASWKPATMGYNMSTAAFLAGTTSEYPPPSKLVFTTPARNTATTWMCAGPFTVEAQEAGGTPRAVGAATPLVLSGNFEYFSDSSCLVPVNSITMGAGTTNVTFYAMGGAAGTLAMATGVTGITNASQNFTVAALTPYTWTGGATCGTNGKHFNTPACWFGGNVPDNTVIAHFDGNCASNCSPTVNGAIDVYAIWLHKTYAGNFDLAGQSLSAVGFYVAGGTFTGGSGPIDVTYAFGVSGGTFNSTSGVFTLGGVDRQPTHFLIIDAPTFNANGGQFVFAPVGEVALIDPGSVSLYDVKFAGTIGTWWAPYTIHGTLNVAHNLEMAGDADSHFCQDQEGTIAVSGDVTATSGGFDWWNECGDFYATLKMVGSGAQAINVAAGVDALPHQIEIASSGTTTLTGTLVADGWKYTSGTFTGGTVNFVGGYETIDASSTTFNNVIFGEAGQDYWVSITGNMTIQGDMTVEAITQGNLIGGTILSFGNVTFLGGDGGTASIYFVGSNNVTFTNSGAGVPIGYGDIIVTKTNGSTMTLNNDLVSYSGDGIVVNGGIVHLNGHQINSGGTGGYPFSLIGSLSTLECDGGCGAGTDCNQGTGGLACSALQLIGGPTINP